ncbi:unnamed protein product [Calicophoron daubneyi]|uniref:Uncharacterized protein n=1 Tax=Calicophoron daubneyi TaxID=300641 RepID=A0AAV2TPR6_CALDB
MEAHDSRHDAHYPPNDKDAAAAKIQAGVRGYLTRKHMGHEPEHKQAQHGLETEHELDPDKAATRIQAGFRGYRTRQKYHVSHPSNMSGSHSAHQLGRGQKYTTHEIHENLDADAAATRIQAAFRGYETRKTLHHSGEGNMANKSPLKTHDQNSRASNPELQSVGSQREESPKTHAATVIQAGFRGYQTRKALHPEIASRHMDTNKSHQPIDKTQPSTGNKENRGQAGGHGRTGVTAGSHSPAEDPNEAATRIQATFRGFRARQEVHVPHEHATDHIHKSKHENISKEQ